MNAKQRRQFFRKWKHEVRVKWKGYEVYDEQRTWLKENCKKGTYYTDDYSAKVLFTELSDASSFTLRFI